MATNLEDRETLELWPETAEEAEEQAFLDHLRANGVRLGRQSLDRPRVIGAQRPMWLACIVRILRRLRLIDD
jgi:hypothetical protein